MEVVDHGFALPSHSIVEVISINQTSMRRVFDKFGLDFTDHGPMRKPLVVEVMVTEATDDQVDILTVQIARELLHQPPQTFGIDFPMALAGVTLASIHRKVTASGRVPVIASRILPSITS